MKSAARLQLDAVEWHLFDQQRARRRHPHEHARTAPIPSDPMQCRWCRGKLKLLIDGDPESKFCQNLCMPSDSDGVLCQCVECNREFRSGKRFAALCYECESRERQERPSNERPMLTRDRFGERLRGR